MALASSRRALVLAALFNIQPASTNWLLQCSSCVDQAYFGDESLKKNIKDADTQSLLSQIKQLRLREFEHRDDEFYNKFFSKRQLGFIAQEAQTVMPSAVAQLPERRWTNAKGVSNTTKNVMLLRDSHLLMTAIGSLQVLAHKAEYWDTTIQKLEKDMVIVVQEQDDNRRKREDMLEQILRIIAKVEVLQLTLAKTEESFARLDTDMGRYRTEQDERSAALVLGLEELRNKSEAQDLRMENFTDEFRAAVEREARADLVEKRKAVETELEVQKVKLEIEKVRWEEEQKTVQMRGEEQRHTEEHSSTLHQARVAHELAQKKIADLELLLEQEASNLRQEEAKRKGEEELLKLRLASDERRAEIGVTEAIEKAKVEQEAKIRERRENEDVNLRALKAEMVEKRQQTLAAIRASAEIMHSWVSSIYSSPKNLLLAIGSIVVALGGVYLAREMAILLREQLNKRLGRPSLVRTTNRRGLFQELWIGLLRLLRLRAPRGAEFSDVVLDPRLHKQVMRLADATASAKKRRMPLQHVMFYGPPGTGKTMVAQRFAEYSGLEYAIMAGGDVAPLQEQAVTELHKLFKWVKRSRRGVLLFIDEADAFLANRNQGSMSEPLRNALTTMLYHTGTPSSQFMLVLATNRPQDLDSAIHSRVDESVEFGLPEADARVDMVRLYFNMYISKPLGITTVSAQGAGNKVSQTGSPPRGRFGRTTPAPVMTAKEKAEEKDAVDDASLVEVARRLHGFSGREISKLFTSLQTHVLSDLKAVSKSGLRRLPKELVLEVVDQKVREHGRTADFQLSGYNYEHKEEPISSCSTSEGTATPSEITPR